MTEVIIPIDLEFADHLDLNCAICLPCYSDNKPQERLIRGRRPTQDYEKRTLGGLLEQCKRCFSRGRNFSDSITATASCTWRSNIRI